MIDEDISVKLPFLWGTQTFCKSKWSQINIIVGPNGSGKTLLAEELAKSFSSSGKKTTFLHSATINEESFIKILSEKPDIHTKIESVLSNLLGKSIKLKKEKNKLIPTVINKERNLEYNMYKNECHGLKKIITLLVELYASKSKVLIIDEPELHLHPQFQSFFMNEIRKITKSNKNRIFFIITHSPFFIDLRSPEDLLGMIVCHVNSKPTTISSLLPQDENLFKRFLPRFNPYHKQFFFSDNQIFVEGYTDQQIFTALLQSVESPYKTCGTGIIDVGGKDELGVFFKVCSLLGTNPRIITDLDSLFSGKLREEICADKRTNDFLNENYINYKTLYQQIFQEFSNQQKISMYKLIQKLEQMILTIGKTLLSFEENYVQDKNIKLYIEKLKKLKEKYENTEGIDTYKTVLLQGITKIPEKLKNVLPVPVSRTIPLIINLFNLIIKAAQACRIYILPSGCIEHYYYKTKVDYMPVSAKDKLFHIEYDYLCNATPKQLKKSYPKLIEILEKACKI